MVAEKEVRYHRRQFEPGTGDLVLEEVLSGTPDLLSETLVKLGYVKPPGRPEEPDAAAGSGMDDADHVGDKSSAVPRTERVLSFIRSRDPPSYAFTLDQVITYLGASRALSPSVDGWRKNGWYRVYKATTRAMEDFATETGGAWAREPRPNAEGQYVYRFKPDSRGSKEQPQSKSPESKSDSDAAQMGG